MLLFAVGFLVVRRFFVLHFHCVIFRGAAKILFEHPRKIQRLGKPADVGYLGDILPVAARGDKQLFRHLHSQTYKVVVRGHAHFALEQLSQIVVAERDSFQISVKLVVAVGEILHNVALYRADNVAQRLGALERDNVVHDEISECRDYKLLVVYLTVEVVERVVERGQNMVVAVVGNNYRRLERQRGVRDVHMNVCKALFAVVRVRDLGRYNNDISDVVFH